MKIFSIAIKDISGGLARLGLIGVIGWQDVKQRYRRSVLGPFWLTISMGIMIGTIGAIFGKILNIPYAQFLPYLSIGMISWGFISTTITEGCMSFIIGEAVIKQIPLPFFIYILRIIWRNLTILGHNVVILPFTLFLLPAPFTLKSLLVLPGIFLVILNLAWIVLLMAIICARFRDLPQIISNLFQVIFYVTPIMWLPNNIIGIPYLDLLLYNPFYHFIEIIRAPLLGDYPSALSWWFCITSAIFGSLLSAAVLGFYKRRIIYWL